MKAIRSASKRRSAKVSASSTIQYISIAIFLLGFVSWVSWSNKSNERYQKEFNLQIFRKFEDLSIKQRKKTKNKIALLTERLAAVEKSLKTVEAQNKDFNDIQKKLAVATEAASASTAASATTTTVVHATKIVATTPPAPPAPPNTRVVHPSTTSTNNANFIGDVTQVYSITGMNWVGTDPHKIKNAFSSLRKCQLKFGGLQMSSNKDIQFIGSNLERGYSNSIFVCKTFFCSGTNAVVLATLKSADINAVLNDDDQAGQAAKAATQAFAASLAELDALLAQDSDSD